MPSHAEPQSRAGMPAAPTAVSGLDALLALQAVDADRPGGRRRAVKQGTDLLDALEEIRIGLLSGSIAGEALERVLALVSELEPSGDAGLDALVADIALRAEVEAAKLGRFRAGS